MSVHLRKGISLANVPLPPNPPPLPTPQGAVQVLRALNRCGPFSGKFFALVAIVDWCLIRLVEWLFPRQAFGHFWALYLLGDRPVYVTAN